MDKSRREALEAIEELVGLLVQIDQSLLEFRKAAKDTGVLDPAAMHGAILHIRRARGELYAIVPLLTAH